MTAALQLCGLTLQYGMRMRIFTTHRLITNNEQLSGKYIIISNALVG